MEHFPVIGIPIAVTDYDGALAQVTAWAKENTAPRCVSATNVHGTTLARLDPEFGNALSQFDMLLPDGMSMVWVMNRSIPEPLKDRVYGPTYMLRCIEATQGEGLKHLLIGGTEELLAELREKLLARFPKLQLAESYAPPFGKWSKEEDERIIEHIRKSGAQFVWIGLGCPKQELWLGRHKAQLPPAVYSAVGAAFAFHAGRLRQAPAWMQNNGLEWFFRLCTEPRRLWRRYVFHISMFFMYLIRDAFQRRRSGA